MMSVFPATMPQDHERQTDELCRLFSDTLHSLAADAAAVRQLTSLAKLSGVVLTSNDEENDKPNILRKNEETLKGLCDLDQLVTGIEQKVVALRQIVTEEKRALDKFESTMKEEADDQAATIQEMLKVCQEVGALEPKPSFGTSRAPLKSRRDSFDPRSKNTHKSTSKNTDDKDTEVFSLDRVTSRELKGVYRNMLGRISLMDLNEALEEIEQVSQSKIAALPTYKGLTSNSLHRRYEYLKQQRANVNLEVEAHAGHTWVSEQELREHCAFFRHGESTARATLTILCSLKRLKQVPGRNMEITYICLPDESTQG
jgi:hypothetical protein